MDKTLVDYITNPGDKGKLATIHPNFDNLATDYPGGDPSGPDSPSTDEFSNGFTLEFDFEFDHTRGDGTNGYVAIDRDADGPGSPQHKLSFVGNSGIKFGSYTRPDGQIRPFEVSILDVESMVAVGGGLPAFAAGARIDAAGNVSILGYAPEKLRTLMSGVEYTGLYESMHDNPSKPTDPGTASNYYDTLVNNMSRSAATKKMKIEVAKSGTSFDVTVELNGSTSYSRSGISITGIGSFLFQTHWGSGVIFSNVKATTP